MSDAQVNGPETPPQITRLFNRTTQPRVLHWGEGVVMPGESFLTDHPETFAPDEEGSAWTVDAEAVAALQRSPQAPLVDSPPSAPAAPSEPQDAPQGANQVPSDLAVSPNPESLTVEANGEVVDPAGHVVGFVDPAEQAANPTPQE